MSAKPTLGIILQARMGSTRLPGKILKTIGRKSILEHIFFRLSYLEHQVLLVVATSDCSKDDVVEKYCLDRKVQCFRGSENNVLDRYYRCAQKYFFKNIVRMTADNPFTDMEELDRLIDLHIENRNDYSHSFGVMPLGVGVEIFTFSALERSHREGTAPNHIEHVNEYMQEHPEIF